MNKRDHLKRLPPEYYQGDAIVHWTLTIRTERQGLFYYRFRELLAFRYEFACPIFCLMPDHFHMLGLSESCDQLLAICARQQTSHWGG
jgi:putative transposase